MALWDRRDDESAKAYAAFTGYRDLGKDRSVDKSYQQQTVSKTGARRRAPGHWWDWYEAFDWKNRAEQYDANLERQARKQAEETHRRNLRDFGRRQQERAEKLHRAAMGLIDRALERMETLDAADLDAGQLVAALRAGAVASSTAGNAEAVTLGVEELLKALPNEPGDDS